MVPEEELEGWQVDFLSDPICEGVAEAVEGDALAEGL